MSLRVRVAQLAARWQETRVARALRRMSTAAGGPLAGGIAYAFLFSLAAALTLGFTVLARVVGASSPLRADFVAIVDDALPGLLDTGDGQGLVHPDDLILSTGGIWAGLVAAAVLVWSATTAMSALRIALRAVAGVREPAGAVLGKARDLGGLLGLGLAVFLAAAVGLVLTSVTGALGDALGLPWADAVGSQVVGLVVTGLLDAVVYVLMVRVLAELTPGRRDLWTAAALVAVAFGLLRWLGAAVVAGSAQANPLFASIAVLATLLVWLNLLSRILLTVTAWMVEGQIEDPTEKPAED